MTFLKPIIHQKANIIFLGLLAVGIIMTAFPFLYTAEQCPDDFTQQAIDDSNCIVGADIGSGIIFILGIFNIIVAVTLLSLSFLSSRFRNLSPLNKIFATMAVYMFIYVLLSSALYFYTKASIQEVEPPAFY